MSSAGGAQVYVRSDRFLVPLHRAARRYHASHLRAPHSFRQRAFRFLNLLRLPGARPAGEVDHELLEMVLAEARATGLRDVTPLIVGDYGASRRERVLAFLFSRDEPSPIAVMKLRPTSAEGAPLKREAEALQWLRARLSTELCDGLPDVIRHAEADEHEVLVMTSLSGRNAYQEMQSALFPFRSIEPHFERAAEWLATLHLATADGTLGEEDARTARHGDFWARNVLFSPRGVGVVDWEFFQERASPWGDFFHFALTYGLNYPWKRYQRIQSEEAFRQTFLEKTRLSSAIASYASRYRARTGVARAQLEQAFRRFLQTRGMMSDATPELPAMRELPWEQFLTALSRSGASAFSG